MVFYVGKTIFLVLVVSTFGFGKKDNIDNQVYPDPRVEIAKIVLSLVLPVFTKNISPPIGSALFFVNAGRTKDGARFVISIFGLEV